MLPYDGKPHLSAIELFLRIDQETECFISTVKVRCLKQRQL